MLDYIGQKFGNWTVIDNAERGVNKHRQVKCKCDCGHEAVKRLETVKDYPTKRCMQCKHKNKGKD